MTEYQIANIVDRLLGDSACYLNETLTTTIASRVLRSDAPRALVIAVDQRRSSAWGTHRRFSTLGHVEVYA